MLGLNSFLEPGNLVINPSQLSWGTGQVQSVISNRITINFENAGKLTLDGEKVELELLEDGS